MADSTEAKFTVEQMRGAYGHRAEWLWFLSQAGLDDEPDDGPLHAAIRACGHYHGAKKFGEAADDLQAFADVFRSEPARSVFEMNTHELTSERFEVSFHTCPLVDAWKAAGATPEQISRLCDIAMAGDRGIIDELGTYDFDLAETIADGADQCLIRISRK